MPIQMSGSQTKVTRGAPMYGPKNAADEDTYLLCEINISSVYPFPNEALMPLAEETLRRLRARQSSR